MFMNILLITLILNLTSDLLILFIHLIDKYKWKDDSDNFDSAGHIKKYIRSLNRTNINGLISTSFNNKPSIKYANGIYVAITNGAGIYWSEDGKIWNECESIGKEIKNSSWASLDYSKGIWVAVGSDNNGIIWSEDGKHWNATNITNGTWVTVTCNDDIWIASSQSNGLYWSKDGIYWMRSNIHDGEFRVIVYGRNMWIAGCRSANYSLIWSRDGKTWYVTESEDILKDIGWTSLTYANGLWVAGSYCKGLWYSKNGLDWIKSIDDKNNLMDWDCIAYHNNMWIASSDRGTWKSEDGKNWIRMRFGQYISDDCPYMIYFNNAWMVFCKGNNNDQLNGLWVSKDCIRWTKIVCLFDFATDKIFVNNLVHIDETLYMGFIGFMNEGLLYSVDSDRYKPKKWWKRKN